MFAKFSAFALVALPLVSALTINPLTDATSGGTVTITWTASTTDAESFSILMVNPVNFHNTFAIANTVKTVLGQLVLTLPSMPSGAGYSLQAIANNDVNTVYSQSTPFSVGPVTSTTGTATSTDSAASTTDSASSSAATTLSETAVSTSTHASSVSTPATSSSTSSSATSSSHTGGAAPLRLGGIAPAAALLLSAVAGAVMIF
ncbi:hypothetical protein JVU11DRAFT_10943 [Chiua virens]|nr:hypothetical protein JVU11DRAFT_10943 [Chiua virens]